MYRGSTRNVMLLPQDLLHVSHGGFCPIFLWLVRSSLAVVCIRAAPITSTLVFVCNLTNRNASADDVRSQIVLRSRLLHMLPSIGTYLRSNFVKYAVIGFSRRQSTQSPELPSFFLTRTIRDDHGNVICSRFLSSIMCLVNWWICRTRWS